MVLRANPPVWGGGYRIKVGQTIAGNVWSNAAFTVTGWWTIIYDDGDPDFWPISASASGSARANVGWFTNQIAKKNGWVVGGNVGAPGIAQRGQAYTVAFVIDANLLNAVDIIGTGYIYAGHTVELGDFVEPGPAGGHGFVQVRTAADPAAGSDIAALPVPAGAIWLLRQFTVQLVQGITQTPLPTLAFRGLGVTLSGQFPIAPTAITASSTAQLTWAIGVTQISFTAVVGDEFHIAPIPMMYLVATDDFRTITDGIGANTNYGVAAYTIEEWVMPN